jgi:Ca2+-binding RTX toxin-like protein
MSRHFLNGITYDAFDDTGPGTIIVDPHARIVPSDATFDALTLNGGGWNVIVSGLVFSEERAIFLVDSGVPVSNIKIKAGGEVSGADSGIVANHATNISNAGKISAKSNLFGIVENGAGDYTIRNLKGGVIEGGLAGINIENLGTHTITNAGTIAAYNTDPFGAIAGHDGVEKVINWGRIEGNASLGGGVTLGDGNDVFTNFKKVHGIIKQGTVTGVINLDAGDDIFNGGKHKEVVRDNAGTDTYKLGGGNDAFFAVYTSTAPSGDGADIVNGGGGFDIYSAIGLASNGFLTVNLDTVDHFGIAAQSAKLAANGSTLSIDTIIGFESVGGTDGFDIFVGSKGADSFGGGAGQDTIFGLGGADVLSGGADNDSFIYTSLKDSGPTKETRDTIIDFQNAGFPGGDLIDLQALNTNNDFHFVGNDVAFDGNAGAIIATKANGETIIRLDVNGDKVADFSIDIDGMQDFAGLDFQL